MTEIKKIVQIFWNSTVLAIENSGSKNAIKLPVEFAWDLLHQLFTITKANIVHRDLGYLLNQDFSGKLDSLLDSIQPDFKKMLRSNCTPPQNDDAASNFSTALSTLYCNATLDLLLKYKLDYLLTEDQKHVLDNILSIVHANHTVLLSKALGTGGTDFTYFLQKNIEQNKAAALPLPAEKQVGFSVSSMESYLKSGAPSFLVGMTSSFSGAFVGNYWGEKYAEKANNVALVIVMAAVGYSSSSIATLFSLQLALEMLGRALKIPEFKKYATYLSWAFTLLSISMRSNPEQAFGDIVLGSAANFLGNKIGHSAGSNTASFFAGRNKSHSQATLYEAQQEEKPEDIQNAKKLN